VVLEEDNITQSEKEEVEANFPKSIKEPF